MPPYSSPPSFEAYDNKSRAALISNNYWEHKHRKIFVPTKTPAKYTHQADVYTLTAKCNGLNGLYFYRESYYFPAPNNVETKEKKNDNILSLIGCVISISRPKEAQKRRRGGRGKIKSTTSITLN